MPDIITRLPRALARDTPLLVIRQALGRATAVPPGHGAERERAIYT